MLDRDFPGGAVAKTLNSQCRGPGFHPWSGNQIPYATTKSSHVATKSVHAATEKKKKPCMLQQRLEIPHTTAKTQHSQINKWLSVKERERLSHPRKAIRNNKCDHVSQPPGSLPEGSVGNKRGKGFFSFLK